MNDNTSYERDHRKAEDDGTALAEQTDDFAPVDLYHAARDIADTLGEAVLRETWETIGVAGIDPTLWERLDVARAASYLRHHHPDAFAGLTPRYPWLAEYADSAAHDPMGALSDQF